MDIEKSAERKEDKVDIRNQQIKFLNLICACMIHEPNYYSTADTNKSVIATMVDQISLQDPEFILKCALYVRDDLNIRSTANFLLALAANNKCCHPFFKKYFKAIIRLPSDLLEVVTMFMFLEGRYLNGVGVPTVLRKAAVKKFPDFDVYQLAKYNKEKAQKRKDRKKRKRDDDQMDIELDNSGKEKQGRPKLLTLKQLIRKVHIPSPADYVMSIVGKKYPSTAEDFAKSGLSGEWDDSRAGKRMKLPTPETWETLLSAKGNKHTTWEELLDHKKLPFMAMLRNLRNMLITGMSPAHHEMVLNRLTDEKAVTTSRQLPWRFLSAYQAIDLDLEKMMNDILDHDGSGEKIIEVPVRGKKGRQMGAKRTIKKRVIIPVHMPDLPLIQRYRTAIDTAIRVATLHNLKPIEGKTVVFCDVSGSMKSNRCSSKGNMGTIQQAFEIAVLLGLMLQDVCEECDFRVFSSPSHKHKQCHVSVPLKPNTILDNIKRVTAVAEELGGGTDFPYEYLQGLISSREKIDNFIILSDMMIAPGYQEMQQDDTSVTMVLKEYREKVNPDLLFVAVDLYGNGKSLVEVNTDSPKDVLITGFSDNILRFVAERGSQKQLEYVQKIDQTKGIGADGKKRKDKKQSVDAASEKKRKEEHQRGKEEMEQ